jgi:hypothetical protein
MQILESTIDYNSLAFYENFEKIVRNCDEKGFVQKYALKYGKILVENREKFLDQEWVNGAILC